MELIKDQNQIQNDKNQGREQRFTKDEAKKMLSEDYNGNFSLFIKEKLSKKLENQETITQVLRRTALAIAVARIKYRKSPADIIQCSLEVVIEDEAVLNAAAIYYQAFGKKDLTVNQITYMNASPETSLYILQYEAHAELIGLTLEQAWQSENQFKQKYNKLVASEKEKVKAWINELKNNKPGEKQKVFYPHMIEKCKHECAMGYYATKFEDRGLLNNFIAVYVGDSVSDFGNATNDILAATKFSASVGVNTSSIRPRFSPTTTGIVASGPKNFIDTLFKQAMLSVANGNLEKNTFIELRDTTHPDVTEFLKVETPVAMPNFSQMYDELSENIEELQEQDFQSEEEFEAALKLQEVDLLQKALTSYGEAYSKYKNNKKDLKQSMICFVDGFMEYVEKKEWYPVKFNGSFWKENLLDYAKPILDSNGKQKNNPLTGSPAYEPYSISIQEFPDALESAQKQGLHLLKSSDGNLIQAKKDGTYCFYAPDIFKRVCTSIFNKSELKVLFSDLMKDKNANLHLGDLTVYNPCTGECLPAQKAKNGSDLRGNSSQVFINVASKSYFDESGNYNSNALENSFSIATQLADDLATVTHFPNFLMTLSSRQERRLALSLTGLIDLLVKNKIEVGSEEANLYLTSLFDKLSKSALEKSKKMAEARGTYDFWQGSSYYTNGMKVRNSKLISQASCDFASKFCGVSDGSDLYEKIVYEKEVSGKIESYAIPSFVKAMQEADAWPYSEEEVYDLLIQIMENGNKITGLDCVPLDIQKLFKTSSEIAPESYTKYFAALKNGCGESPEIFPSLECKYFLNDAVSPRYIASILLNAYKLGLTSVAFNINNEVMISESLEENKIDSYLRFVPTDVLAELDLLGDFMEDLDPEEIYSNDVESEEESSDDSEETNDDSEESNDLDAVEVMEDEEDEVEDQEENLISCEDEGPDELEDESCEITEENSADGLLQNQVSQPEPIANFLEELEKSTMEVCAISVQNNNGYIISGSENTLESQPNITQENMQKNTEINITEQSITNDLQTSQVLESNQLVKPNVRPKRLYGFNEEVLTPEGPVRIHVYFDHKGPCEVFAHGGNPKNSQMSETICRMATKMLKCGISPQDVASELQTGGDESDLEANSMSDAISRVLLEAVEDQQRFEELNLSGDSA